MFSSSKLFCVVCFHSGALTLVWRALGPFVPTRPLETDSWARARHTEELSLNQATQHICNHCFLIDSKHLVVQQHCDIICLQWDTSSRCSTWGVSRCSYVWWCVWQEGSTPAQQKHTKGHLPTQLPSIQQVLWRKYTVCIHEYTKHASV